MGYPHRIAAGGIIFRGNSVLLVRYREDKERKTSLVGPGGALEDNENIIQAIIRETKEETGVIVEPNRVIIIEDLISSSYQLMGICKMIKIWMVCNYITGNVHGTADAEKEGIIEADWFTRDQLKNEKVFPTTLMEYDWEQIQKETWRIKILSSRNIEYS